jgi:hypothetical protein
MDWPERGWNGEHPFVLCLVNLSALTCHPERLLLILSEVKNLIAHRVRSFADAQDAIEEPIRLSSLSELMAQYVRINGNVTRMWFIVSVGVSCIAP